MKGLAYRQRFCDGRLAARFLREPSTQLPLVLCIPGGPGLGSSYLDGFMTKLAQHASVNVGILDLPNHGESTPTLGPITYPECADLVKKGLLEILSTSPRTFLFGQSFGARLVFDVLPKVEGVSGAILTGFPYVFQMSEALLEKLDKLDLKPLDDADSADEVFAENWKKIFPYYTTHPLASEVAAALSNGTRWSNNERMLAEVPAVEIAAHQLMKGPTHPPILIIEGDLDGVVPNANFETLKSLVPDACFERITDCGHFPMVEKPDQVLASFSIFVTRILSPSRHGESS